MRIKNSMSASQSLSLYEHMQAAVDIVATSQHPTNKVAATIAGKNAHGDDYAVSRVNYWPYRIQTHIGTKEDIGNASGTIHAETACILDAPQTEGASIFITDPPCPNCMKNMAEAGIAKLYIDHKGFDKDWAKRRGDSFDQMSMRVAERAGIDVYVIYRKEEKFEIISRHPPGYKPSIEHPAVIEQTDQPFETLIQNAHKSEGTEPFALALAENTEGQNVFILVDRNPTVGYTAETVEPKDDKYSFILQPINRLLMIASKEGLTLDPVHIYSSRVPTARELVNFIGAGLDRFQIGDMDTYRDQHGPEALNQLINARIIKVS